MKFELVSTQDISTKLGDIQKDRKKKDELKALGFTFNVDNEKNYSLESFPFEDFRIFSHTDDKIHITISHNGTMVATKENNSQFNQNEKQKIDAVVKKMYELLGIKEDEYQSVKQTGLGVASANAASAPLPPTKNYHSHLAAHVDALNTALKPHLYQVNTTNNTLEKIGADGTPTGHKITVNQDGSTKGDLYSDLTNTDVIAKNIADDHIAVVNMHLALLKQGIKPDKKINLFLIKENLSAEDKAKLPVIETKIKELLAEALAKPEYKDIKEFIVYDGTPIEKKPAAKPEPPREKNFIQKIIAGEDTGKMWLRSNNVIDIPIYVLQKYCHDFTRVSTYSDTVNITLNDYKDGEGNPYLPNTRPSYLALSENGNHFVLVWADKENNLHYYNSMSGDPKAKEEELRLKFPGFGSYEVEYSREQTDENEAWSCGYRVARKILELESENDPELKEHPLVKAKNAPEIRDAFVAEAKERYIHKIQLLSGRLLQDPYRHDWTQVDKMQYYEVSEACNELFFHTVAGLDTNKLNKAITDLLAENPKFRHALLETAPHYIYYNNGKDNELGVGENGMGQNNMGIALMEARNELFRQKDAKHPLIVNDTKKLLADAHKERGEVDNLVGAEETKGKSIREIMVLVRKANKAKTEADAPTSPKLGMRKGSSSE